jgi:hypothetical protein
MTLDAAIQIVGAALLILGVLVCALNFYLSFVRYPLHLLRGNPGQYRHVSGLPVLGSVLVVAALLMTRLPGWAVTLGIASAVLDTGGLHWFAAVMAWDALIRRS